jgi:hypothetical protein
MFSQPSSRFSHVGGLARASPASSVPPARLAQYEGAAVRRHLARHIWVTSYWLRDTKEMAGINTMLIILIHR